jgi:hypothetical protein
MVRCLALFVPLLLALGACAGTGSPRTAEDGVDVIGLEREFHGATISSGWVNLRTLELNADSEAPEADDLYVRGLVTGWIFAPDGAVTGPLKPVPEDAEIEEVWLRLKDRSIHPRGAGDAPPAGATIAGAFDRDTELFYPRDRVVVGRRPMADPDLAEPSTDDAASSAPEPDRKP